MRVILLSIFAVMISVMSHAQEKTDTVKVIENAAEVNIVKRHGNIKVIVSDKAGNQEYEYEYADMRSMAPIDHDWMPSLPFLNQDNRGGKVKTVFFGNTYIGMSVPTEETPGMTPSAEFGVSDLIGLSYAPTCQGFSINIGLGAGYRIQTLGDGKILSCENRILSTVTAPEGSKNLKSRIRSFSIQIPVMLTQKIYRTFGVSAGAIVMMNTYTTATSSYTTGNVTHKEIYKGLHQRFLTVELMAAIGSVGNAGFYVKYSPMDHFYKDYGPEYKTISAGITFGF